MHQARLQSELNLDIIVPHMDRRVTFVRTTFPFSYVTRQAAVLAQQFLAAI